MICDFSKAAIGEFCNCCGCLPATAVPKDKYTFSIPDVLLCASTGDLMLFSGYAITSKMMEFICDSRWSHAGLVVRDSNNVPLLLEADFHKTDIKDSITGQPEVGVRLVPLGEMLMKYEGNYVAIRKVQCTNKYLSKIVKDNLNKVITKFIENHHLRSYEHNVLEFILAQYHMCGRVKQNNVSFFCTEIVAKCYMDAGILVENGTTPNQYLPQDFCGDSVLPFKSPHVGTGNVSLSRPMFIDLKDESLVESKTNKRYHYKQPPRRSMRIETELFSPPHEIIDMSLASTRYENETGMYNYNRRGYRKRETGFGKFKRMFCYM